MGTGAGLDVEEVEFRERWKRADGGGEGAEELDGAEAVGVEGVVDVAGEIGADGVGTEGDAGRPLGN